MKHNFSFKITGHCIEESHWKCIFQGIFKTNPSVYDKFEITKIEICRNSTTTTTVTTQTMTATTTTDNLRDKESQSQQVKHQGHSECQAKIISRPKSETSGRDANHNEQSKTDEKSYIIIVAVCTACVAFVFMAGIYISQKR